MSFFRKLCTGTALAVSLPASSAIITQSGTDVSFVYDDSTLFGTGTVIGNSILFVPTDFFLESIDGISVSALVEVLNIDIISQTSGYGFDRVEIREFGDYILDDGVNGNDPSVGGASVSASLRTQVWSLNPQWIGQTSIETVQTGVITAPQDGTTVDWSLTNVNEWMWGTDDAVKVQLQNTLIADTDAEDERAFIQKKAVPIIIEVVQVPVPAAAWLFASGLAALGVFRSKR